MGQFDFYQLAGEQQCPDCDTDLIEWQGTGGDCGLFV